MYNVTVSVYIGRLQQLYIVYECCRRVGLTVSDNSLIIITD